MVEPVKYFAWQLVDNGVGTWIIWTPEPDAALRFDIWDKGEKVEWSAGGFAKVVALGWTKAAEAKGMTLLQMRHGFMELKDLREALAAAHRGIATYAMVNYVQVVGEEIPL